MFPSFLSPFPFHYHFLLSSNKGMSQLSEGLFYRTCWLQQQLSLSALLYATCSNSCSVRRPTIESPDTSNMLAGIRAAAPSLYLLAQGVVVSVFRLSVRCCCFVVVWLALVFLRFMAATLLCPLCGCIWQILRYAVTRILRYSRTLRY